MAEIWSNDISRNIFRKLLTRCCHFHTGWWPAWLNILLARDHRVLLVSTFWEVIVINNIEFKEIEDSEHNFVRFVSTFSGITQRISSRQQKLVEIVTSSTALTSSATVTMTGPSESWPRSTSFDSEIINIIVTFLDSWLHWTKRRGPSRLRPEVFCFRLLSS